MTLPVQDRWWLTSRGIDVLVKEGYWEIPWSTTQSGIKLLLQRLPMVEQVYRILPALRVADEIGNLKPILDFNWFHGSRIHAVAHYDHDVLVMFTWVGLSSKSPVLRDKWADHLVDLQTYHLGSGWDHRMPGYDALADVQPSAWVVVGHDHWSAHIADDVWYPNADVGDKHVYSCGSNLVSTPPSRPSPSWIAETFRQVEVGRPEVLANPTRGDARLKALQGKLPYRVFTFVAEWYGIWPKAIAELSNEWHSSITDVLDPLLSVDLLDEEDKRIFIARGGGPVLSNIDRVSVGNVPNRPPNRREGVVPPRRTPSYHDDQVIRLATSFKQAGAPVYAGWRAVLNFPGEVQIVPDAVVWLGNNPVGAGWFRLEYERTAKRRAQVRDKVWPYRYANSVGQPVPFLVVCDTPAAEKMFQREAQGLPMLTTTYQAARSGPLLGEHTVWRWNGHAVAVQPPTPYSLEVPIVTSPLYTSRFPRRW